VEELPVVRGRAVRERELERIAVDARSPLSAEEVVDGRTSFLAVPLPVRPPQAADDELVARDRPIGADLDLAADGIPRTVRPILPVESDLEVEALHSMKDRQRGAIRAALTEGL
jgi:hypothetical protein